ncbi:hypothetical protein [uncultured Meiothermus sp.]|jgi:hypothetical protein|uniref:hypothetical protein n=1 Tax=uncultured Meiothermus sp. TaxID=157471 RepID=UPI002619C42C|nr:hypothetical protein [uncultured Meiothermus sp.]
MAIKKFIQRQLEQPQKPAGESRKVSLHLSEGDHARAERLRQALGMKSLKELLEGLVMEGIQEAEEVLENNLKK